MPNNNEQSDQLRNGIGQNSPERINYRERATFTNFVNTENLAQQIEDGENREMKCCFVVERDKQNRVIKRCGKTFRGINNLHCEQHRAKDPISQAEKW